MTEADWLAGRKLSSFYGRHATLSGRKLWLASVSFGRLLLRSPAPEVAAAFDALEDFADTGSRADYHRGAPQLGVSVAPWANGVLMWVHRGAGGGGDYRAEQVSREVVERLTSLGEPRASVEQRILGILHDIFGSPFRPTAFSPEWHTSTVLALAQGMYASRDFAAMPILADALQDAGCDDADILGHCRGPGPHVRGCWVVDQVLGKE